MLRFIARQIERHAAATRVESGVEELTEIGRLFHAKFHSYQCVNLFNQCVPFRSCHCCPDGVV